MEGESSEKEKLSSSDVVVVVEVDDDDDDNNNDKLQEVVDEGNKIPIPQSGMRFPNPEEMFEYWKNYGHQMGFTVRKRSSKKDDGVLKYVCFVCSRSARREPPGKDASKVIQPGCGVKLSGRLDKGEWIISNITLDHNHELLPSKVEYLSRGQVMTSNAKRRLDVNGNVGKDSGYCVGRPLQLAEGDVVAIMNYFLKRKVQNNGFFYSMDLDEEGQLKNVFWADGRSREAYKEFGEVVTFDTTYLANKYNMPFVFFVGVSHHGEPMLLGCGLICSKDSESFIWLFRTWLACMSDCAPNGIITDQDTSMQKAVEIVFLNTRHRWCLWHVMKKLLEKLRSSKQYESLSKILQDVVYESQIPEEFEKNWAAMVEEHGLHENEWLSALYCERHRWVPCFVKTSFWAGMSTIHRSESLNSFFEGYVNSTTTLKQFMEQYDNALRSRVEKENQSDVKSFSQPVPCVTRYEMEKQVQEVYTISKFKEFQTEIIGKMYCEFTLIKEDHIVPEYYIREDLKVGEGKKRIIFTVTFNRDECEVKCSCHMFEYRGILCRHAISVLIRNDVGLIPEKYILRRWRKDVRRCHTCVKITYDGGCGGSGGSGGSATFEQQRYDKMFSAFTNLAFLAAEDETSYNGVMALVDNVTKELQARKENSGRNQPIPISAVHPSSGYTFNV